jgi:beta-glucanase (GH16 family)
MTMFHKITASVIGSALVAVAGCSAVDAPRESTVRAEESAFTTPTQSKAQSPAQSQAESKMASVQRVASSSGFRRIFVENFNGTRLDRRKWAPRAVGEHQPSRLKSVSSPRAVSVGGGTLRLQVRKDPRRRGHYLNGHVSTQGKFDFAFGRASARIKFPRGKGQHGAFWLQPTNGKTIRGNAAKSGAEIDVAEYFGDGRRDGGLASFIYNYGILRGGDPVKIGGVWPKATKMLRGSDDWWKNFHTFTVDWTPKRYVFSADGRVHFTTERGVSGIPEFLILSLLTSDWELPALNKASLPTTMKVDWVKVWKR